MLRSRTLRSKRLRYAALLGSVLLPTAAACGIQPTGITALGPAPAAVGASLAQSSDTSPGETQFQVLFYQGTRLTPAYRSVKGEVSESAVLAALIAGPSQSDQAAGLTSSIPADLIAKPRANDELGAYYLSEALGQRAKAQFICTMQYYDQIDSIGIQLTGQARPIWNQCSDTTSQYVPMRSDGSSSIPIPSASS
jgi:hypothetical protein